MLSWPVTLPWAALAKPNVIPCCGMDIHPAALDTISR